VLKTPRRSVVIGLSLVAAVVAAIFVASTTARPLEPTVVVITPTPTPLTASPSSTPKATLPQTGNAEYFFQPGAMRWCGAFDSYRAPSTVASGELKIGSVTFLPTAIGVGAPYAQRIAADVRSGDWVCVIATVIPSDTAANQLTDLSVASAPTGSMPPGPIRATPCGMVNDLFVTDLPSGGFVSLTGTKFLVGGLRAASEVVQLPPAGDLRIGARVCIVGTSLTPLDAGTFTATSGRVMLDR
jgi:hypothetical protein